MARASEWILEKDASTTERGAAVFFLVVSDVLLVFQIMEFFGYIRTIGSNNLPAVRIGRIEGIEAVHDNKMLIVVVIVVSIFC